MNKKSHSPMSLQEPPTEALPEIVKANSPENEQLFTHLIKAKEPRQSIIKQGFAFRPSPSGDENGVDLNDDLLYYNTQGSAKDY